MSRRLLGPAVLVAALAASARAEAALTIVQAEDAITVTTGAYRWEISTTVFDVLRSASIGGRARVGPGRATVEALGATLVFGPPSEVRIEGDSVELRGWAARSHDLWYVARYQFFADRPFVRLVLTLTDRHDRSPATDPWAKHWENRRIGPWRLEVGAPGGEPRRITQHDSFGFSSGDEPWVETLSASGAPYQWRPAGTTGGAGLYQLLHDAGDPANQVVWHPMVAGAAELTAVIERFRGGAAYLAAPAVVYEIIDAHGRSISKTIDQGSGDLLALGTYTLGKSSSVRLRATGTGRVIAGSLRVEPAGGRRFDIALGARASGALTDGDLTLAVKDFWQHHPASLIRTRATLGWEMIARPATYTGGMGLTIETLIALEGPAYAAIAALYAPPRRAPPGGRFGLGGSMKGGAVGARYDALLRAFAERLQPELERQDSHGWRNWGDYQIGTSYTDKWGSPIENWANLQYDLPYGLLLAWMRTGDPRLWRHAQASVRHLMDIDLVKFQPFAEKLNGLVYRKGEMPSARSHISAEPVVDQGFAWRSLLLYQQLTGERWAGDLAKQHIDRLVRYAVTGPRYVLDGDRPTGWMLLAALAGSEQYPDDPSYRSAADRIVQLLVGHYAVHRRLPGAQPVWQGQMVDGLAWYHHKTGRADVAEVIVGHVRHLLANCLRQTPDGGYQLMYCDPKGGGDCATPTWVGEDSYLFLWLNAIAYASTLSRDPWFARSAELLFNHGEAKLKERHDIRSWTSVLAFPHLYLELAPLAP